MSVNKKSKKKSTKNKKQIASRRLLFSIASFLALGILAIACFGAIYIHNKIFPVVFINNINVSLLTKAEAQDLVSKNLPQVSTINIIVDSEQKTEFKINPSDIDFSFNIEKSVDEAFKEGRRRRFFLATPSTVNLQIKYNNQKLDEILGVIASQTSITPVNPYGKIIKGKVEINTGQKGEEVDSMVLKKHIEQYLSTGAGNPMVITPLVIDPTLSPENEERFREKLTKFIGKKFVVTHEYQIFEIKDAEIADMLSPNGFNDEVISKKAVELAGSINREPQNSVFVFEDGRVKEFTPSKDGITLDQSKMANDIVNTLMALEQAQDQINISAPVVAQKPQINNSEVNNLGINELIGRGASTFRGSISSRIHNVNLAAKRISGNLVAPGQTFSFNTALGDVSKLTGYKEAYIIQDGKTVLGDGGGVCQVSTTLFRAALNAGLNIVERRGHSYRVGYYEQGSDPGIDATVYSPTTDFKIINDTPNHILIQAIVDIKAYSLVFEIYGTTDGRIATITKPVMTNVSAPPEDVYVDDPTLPAGQIKQVEYKAWGGRSSFKYEVKIGDEVLHQKTFVTNYRPWGAVFMRGTGPV